MFPHDSLPAASQELANLVQSGSKTSGVESVWWTISLTVQQKFAALPFRFVDLTFRHSRAVPA
jgi:hypothetical protein